MSDEKQPMLYINRELSWLKFNQRVLGQAMDPAIPPCGHFNRYCFAGAGNQG